MPLDLLGLGSVASGVGSIAGGLLGASASKKSTKEARRQFNQQMNESVQRRVADAKAAGIHPLFALGASVGASPTMHAGQSSTGSAIGEAISGAGRAATNYAQAKGMQGLQEAQVNAANASATRDEAEAQLAISRAKRVEQDMLSRGHDGFSSFPLGEKPATPEETLRWGPHVEEAPRIKSRNPRHPAYEAGPPRPGRMQTIEPDGSVLEWYTDAVPGREEANQQRQWYYWALDYMRKNFGAGRRQTERMLHDMEIRMKKVRKQRKRSKR